MFRCPDGTFRQNGPVKVELDGYRRTFSDLTREEWDVLGYNEAIPILREPCVTYVTTWVKGVDLIYRETIVSSVTDQEALFVYETEQVRTQRAAAYPPIGDQLDALIKELNSRRLAGESLNSEMDSIVNKCLTVKKKYPKPDLDEEEDL